MAAAGCQSWSWEWWSTDKFIIPMAQMWIHTYTVSLHLAPFSSLGEVLLPAKLLWTERKAWDTTYFTGVWKVLNLTKCDVGWKLWSVLWCGSCRNRECGCSYWHAANVRVLFTQENVNLIVVLLQSWFVFYSCLPSMNLVWLSWILSKPLEQCVDT